MTLADVTLSRWIDFTHSCREIDAWLECARSQPESKRKAVLLTNNYAERAFAWCKFFELDIDNVNDAVSAYEAFMAGFNEPAQMSLPALMEIKAGQFIDIKQIISATADTLNHWEHIRYVIAIFSNEYDDKNSGEDSPAYERSGSTPIAQAAFAIQWFDNLNKEIAGRYSLFAESEEQEQPNMKHHMKQWGWVNFLKSIAKTKVFDVTAWSKNSIDCVRASSLDDVLMWASEEKDYNVAAARDMELSTQK